MINARENSNGLLPSPQLLVSLDCVTPNLGDLQSLLPRQQLDSSAILGLAQENCRIRILSPSLLISIRCEGEH
jgi:hypothetical protein